MNTLDDQARSTHFKPGAASADPPTDASDARRSNGDEDAADSGELAASDRTLGDFRLLRKLGKGGMADVYLAEQTSLKRHVAVKVLRSEQLQQSDELMIKRFAREARAAAALNHANIVQVYSIGQVDGTHYIAQEYVEGLNLRDYLRRKGPPDAALAVHLMKQVAAALAKAGEAGIVHRDIKPENILVTRRGQIKVADFGLAQLTLAGERVNLTQTNITMGTPLYMSPEQVDGRPVDLRSDLYSFGVTCYHMLAGNAPFRGETAITVAVKHLNEDPRPLTDTRPDLPPALCAVVHKMMAKKPEERYPTADALLEDLKVISKALKQQPHESAKMLARFDGMGPDATPSGGMRTGLSAWSGRKRLVVLLVLGLFVSGASAAIGWATRPADPLDMPPRQEGRIPQRDTAEQQYKFAVLGFDDDPEAWQAVIDYFEDEADTRYRRLAMEQLALLYLRHLQLDRATRIFDELALVADGPEARKFKAIGVAGQAVVATLQRRYADSQQIITSELDPPGQEATLLKELEAASELRRFVEQARLENNRFTAPD